MANLSVIDQVPRQANPRSKCPVQALETMVVVTARWQAIHAHLRHNIRPTLPLIDNDFVAGSSVFAFRAIAIKGLAHA
ncbi:hypothetical protein SRABI35_02788 [Stenotrophomonas lactitubi]|nr:hypothetical protein SRABI35_02788 [Stenotrophomonas lactitubi]